MSKRKRVYLLWIMSLMVSIIFYEQSSAMSKKVKLSKKNVTLNEKESCKISLKAANRKKIKWYSSNKKIATVKNGVIKAKAKGRCVVIAKYKRKNYTCAIRVKRTENMSKQPIASAESPTVGSLSSANPTVVSAPKGEDSQSPQFSEITNFSSVVLDAYTDASNKNILFLKISNNSGTDIGTGAHFLLEYYNGSQWTPVSFKDGSWFREIAIIVRDGYEYVQRVDLKQYFVGLSDGKYRITKEIWAANQGIVQTEFTID